MIDARAPNPFDVAELTQAEIVGRRQVQLYAEAFRKFVPGFENCYVLDTGAEIGVRESRRIRGRQRLEADHVLNEARFDNAIACCAWPLEEHGGGRATKWVFLKPGTYYQIPLACCCRKRSKGYLSQADAFQPRTRPRRRCVSPVPAWHSGKPQVLPQPLASAPVFSLRPLRSATSKRISPGRVLIWAKRCLSPNIKLHHRNCRMYPSIELHIDGAWVAGAAGHRLEVLNPATEEVIGTVAQVELEDLENAVKAADKGFRVWRRVSAFERSKIMRRAAEILRSRVEIAAPLLTLEQGKPLGEARLELLAAADIIDWFAEEARRTYGRIVPARSAFVQQSVVKEPVGPVAAFTPWNFPRQSGRPQSFGGAGGWMFGHSQGAGGNAGDAGRTGEGVR